MIFYNTSCFIQRVILLLPFWVSHGTKCAGVIAAAANNSFCGVGIAYSANISGKQVLHLFWLELDKVGKRKTYRP